MTTPVVPLRAAVFDMDGLLIDSEPLWQAAEIEVFGTLGLSLTRDDCRATMGMRIDEVVSYWYRRAPWSGPGQPEVAAAIVAEVIRQVRAEGKALPGVAEVIELFRQLELPMAIASSSYPELIDAVIDTLGIAERIAVRHSAQKEPFGKPHPAVYLTACRMLGVEPAEALAFEDSPNGARAALAAGMRCVFVPDPGLSPEAVAAVPVTLRLSSLAQFDQTAYKRCLHAALPAEGGGLCGVR